MRLFGFISTLILGFGSGLAVGYLTAPTTGKRTRNKLAKDFDSYKDQLEAKANEKLNEAKTILNEMVETPTTTKEAKK